MLGKGGYGLHILLERPPICRARRRWCRLFHPKRLPCRSQGIKDQFTTLCLFIRGRTFTTLLGAYAFHPYPPPSPLTNSDEVKNRFFQDLHALLATGPKTDNRIILDGSNARVGTGQDVLELNIEALQTAAKEPVTIQEELPLTTCHAASTRPSSTHTGTTI
ncbi:unnamed protein product [Schistocephalus solidus]|uniref:Uncharacterized protein n=1 Tax=Schistocephalus solidus TaxID=70667 RepID=A0A183TKM9_SCHSO|nr:unnamed protein product [Schistocephalus solidus]